MLIDFWSLEQTTLKIHYSYHHCSWVVKMTTIDGPIHFQKMAITGFK